MDDAIFLVTSKAGVKKLNFKQKVQALLNDQIKVTIVLAMTTFDDYDTIKRYLKTLFKTQSYTMINVVTLASIAADKAGVALQPEEQFEANFESLPSRQFEANSLLTNKTVRYIDKSEIAGEVQLNASDQPLTKTAFSRYEPLNQAVYENGQLFGILAYEDGQVSQSLLLNRHGELVYRFVKRMTPTTYSYRMSHSAKLTFTDKIAETDDDKNVIYHATEDQAYYDVLSYGDYQRFEDIYGFYAAILRTVVPERAVIFVDLNDNPSLTTYLPQQLIFNY